MKVFTIFTELVLLFHLAWIAWVLFGWLFTRNRRLLTWLHIASVLWGICVEAGPWPCPLTLLEQKLESQANLASYVSFR